MFHGLLQLQLQRQANLSHLPQCLALSCTQLSCYVAKNEVPHVCIHHTFHSRGYTTISFQASDAGISESLSELVLIVPTPRAVALQRRYNVL